jgi:hypothetical protein
MPHHLSRRALNILLNGRYATLGGSNARQRAQQLTTIASAYSRAELIGERGVGTIIAAEIEAWLEMHGLALRSDQEPQ